MKRFSLILVASTLTFGGFSSTLLTGCAGHATQRSTGEFVDDGSITAKVKTALLADDDVSGRAVSVQTFRGTVQLSGFVDSQAQKLRAEEIARGIQGVQAVQNQIGLKANQPPQ